MFNDVFDLSGLQIASGLQNAITGTLKYPSTESS